jgi:hypothetical protein
MKHFSSIACALLIPLATVQIACKAESPAKDPIPTDLGKVETAAEGIFDGALANDAAKISASSKQANDGMVSYRAHAVRDGVPAAVLADLEKAVTAVSALVQKGTVGVELARASNSISAPMSKIYAVYKPPVPVVLLDLDYAGRELVLDAREKDFARATTDADRMIALWGPFRPSLVTAGGATVASNYDTSLNTAKKAIAAADAAATEAAAKTGLDDVDNMENIYKNLPATDPGD